MRDPIESAADALAPVPATPAWRAAMLAVAREPEARFTALRPETTGLDRTLHASEWHRHPVVIVDARPGYHPAPDADALVLAFGECSGDPWVDAWLAAHTPALRAYCAGEFDSIDLFAALRRPRPEHPDGGADRG